MWDRILNLQTAEGRAVYRLVNVLVPQGLAAFGLYMIDYIKDTPIDGNLETATAVILGGFGTAWYKYARDTRKVE